MVRLWRKRCQTSTSETTSHNKNMLPYLRCKVKVQTRTLISKKQWAMSSRVSKMLIIHIVVLLLRLSRTLWKWWSMYQYWDVILLPVSLFSKMVTFLKVDTKGYMLRINSTWHWFIGYLFVICYYCLFFVFVFLLLFLIFICYYCCLYYLFFIIVIFNIHFFVYYIYIL